MTTAQIKQIYNRIKYASDQQGQLLAKLNIDSSADSAAILQKATDLYQYALQLYNTIDTNGLTKIGQQHASNAYRLVKQMKDRVANLQGTINQSQNQDARTEGVGTTTIGDIEQTAKGVLGSNPNLNDPTQASAFDLLAQLALANQQYNWQKASDDLAYQRTNFSTMLNQYQAAGMSRAAALQAASGTLPETAGSQVGAGLSSDMLGAAAQNQNNGVAQQGVANQRESLYQGLVGLHNDQLRINNERWAMEQQYWNVTQQKHAYNAIQRTYDLTYSLHANHVDVPLSATQSQKTYKDWLRDSSDFIAQIAEMTNNGEVALDDDGNLCAVYEFDGETKLTEPIVTAKQIHDASLCKQLYDEIQQHVGDPFYGMMFEQQFMNNAGPRGYHQQEDYSQLQSNLIKAQAAEVALQQVVTQLESAEMNAAAQQKFVVWYNHQADADAKRRVNDILFANDLHIASDGSICRYGYQMQAVTNSGTEDASSWDVPLTAVEMARYGLVDFGMNMDAYYNALSVLQGAKLATDNEHFQNAFNLLHEQDAVALSQLGINKLANENALCLFDDHKWLQGLAGAGIVWRSCGFDRIAATVGGIAVGGFKAASMVEAAKRARAHHMTESYDSEGNLSTSETWDIIK